MSKTADSHGTKRARPESGRDKAPAALGAFAPVLAQRPVSGPPPLPTGGETITYQVPHELLVLARNREKDKARSVAVTPVAPRPRDDEPPPSSELSGLRAKQAVTLPDPEPVHAEPHRASSEQPVPSEPPVSFRSKYAARLAVLLVATVCLAAGYCAVELLHLY
jgi:hypothetical protein